MTDTLSLPPIDDLDTTMRLVARDLAMGLYELDDILKNNNVKVSEFHRWKVHPRFLEYLKQERDQWNAASNVEQRTKLKAGIIMEEFMVKAHSELHETKTPLNQRVELAKLLAKVAGMGEQKVIPGQGGGPGGFQLQINIGPGVAPVQIKATAIPVIDHDPDEPDPSVWDHSDDDGYDPLISPSTLDDDQ